jgi:hypothetical protein
MKPLPSMGRGWGRVMSPEKSRQLYRHPTQPSPIKGESF